MVITWTGEGESLKGLNRGMTGSDVYCRKTKQAPDGGFWLEDLE